jgi:redox-sensitive bicupin YhaK (pirin superfamily)
MSIRISSIVSARTHAQAWTDWIKTIDVPSPGGFSGPATALDHCRVTVPASAPRASADLSAITYVLGDSDIGMRTRDASGRDILTRPGGLVWLPSGHGVEHQHLPAEFGRELRCLQLRVHPEILPPGPNRVWTIEPEEVPEWQSSTGDRIRIVAGSYAGLSAQGSHQAGINFLDVRLRCAVYFDVAPGHNALVYLISGFVLALTEGHTLRLESGQAFALHNPRGNALLQLVGSGQLLILDGLATSDAVGRRNDASSARLTDSVVRLRGSRRELATAE